MSAFALEAASWVFIACSAVYLVRVIVGPGGADRLMALSAISALVLGVLVMEGVKEGRSAFLDVALVYDIFGFLGILAIATFSRDFSPDTRFRDDQDAGDGGTE